MFLFGFFWGGAGSEVCFCFLRIGDRWAPVVGRGPGAALRPLVGQGQSPGGGPGGDATPPPPEALVF